jgi:hypothetical protein
MTDYSFMKSGFDLVAGKVEEEETKQNTVAMIVTYAEGAVCTAAKYISHGKRKGITPEDLKRSMMLEMFFFKKRDNILEKAKIVKEEIFEGIEDDDEEVDFISEENMDEFTENVCVCPLCKCINTIYTRWDGWTPTSEFETIFKEHIDNM